MTCKPSMLQNLFFFRWVLIMVGWSTCNAIFKDEFLLLKTDKNRVKNLGQFFIWFLTVSPLLIASFSPCIDPTPIFKSKKQFFC